MFCNCVRKGVPRNFTKSIAKHLYQSFSFDNVADLRPAILLKKRLWHRFFPIVSFAIFLRTLFFYNRTPLGDYFCPDKSRQNCKLFFCEKLFKDCGLTLHTGKFLLHFWLMMQMKTTLYYAIWLFSCEKMTSYK